MSGWLSYISGKRAPPSRDSTREAIIDLRQHLTALEKKEDFLNKKIEEEVAKAKAALAQGGANGKRVATNSLRQKKMHEAELEKIAGTRVTLETQVGGERRSKLAVPQLCPLPVCSCGWNAMLDGLDGASGCIHASGQPLGVFHRSARR
jgi:hypothetical protein